MRLARKRNIKKNIGRSCNALMRKYRRKDRLGRGAAMQKQVKFMGKRIRNIGIIFLLMMIVYKYAETTVIYQTVMVADQEDIGQDVIETEQMMQMAIEGVYIMQTMINKPYKIVYLKEISV